MCLTEPQREDSCIRSEKHKHARYESDASPSTYGLHFLEESVSHRHQHTGIDVVLNQTSQRSAVGWINVLMVGMDDTIPFCTTQVILMRIYQSSFAGSDFILPEGNADSVHLHQNRH